MNEIELNAENMTDSTLNEERVEGGKGQGAQPKHRFGVCFRGDVKEGAWRVKTKWLINERRRREELLCTVFQTPEGVHDLGSNVSENVNAKFGSSFSTEKWMIPRGLLT